MDSTDSSIWPMWSVLVGAAAALLYAFLTWPFDTFTKLGLTGPKPLPLVGTMLPFFKKPIAQIDMENVKLYGKVYGSFNGRTPVLTVADPDMAKEILIKDFSSFANRMSFSSVQLKPLRRMITVISGDHWKHVRSTLSPTFSSGKLKQMLPTVTNCVDRLMDHIEKHLAQPIAVKDMLAGYTMDVIAGTAFGLDTRSLDEPDSPFLSNAKRFFSFTNLRSPKRLVTLAVILASPKLGALIGKLGFKMVDTSTLDYLVEVVKNAMSDSSTSRKERKDFVSLCLEELVDIETVSAETIKMSDAGLLWTTKGLTKDDIIANAIVILLAGFDTVSTFLSFFCYAMATNPVAQLKAYEEIKRCVDQGIITYEKLKELTYVEMCMDETLRMYPPALRLSRKCNKATAVGGLPVPEGMVVDILVYAIHHNADYWEDPFSFKPERFSPEAKAQLHPCAYLPFGQGPRNCIGMRLALLEAKAAIVSLLMKYEICPCNETAMPPLKFGATFGLLSTTEPIKLAFNKRRVQP